MSRYNHWISVCREAVRCHPQVVLISLLGLLFVFSLGLGMRPMEAGQNQLTPTPIAVKLDNTPLPPVVSINDPTNGIIAGASLMVLIIIGGTLSALRPLSRKRK